MVEKSRRLTIVVVSLGICITVACGSLAPGSRGSPTADASRLSRFALSAYFDLLGGHLSMQALDSNAPPLTDVSADRWKSLASKERKVGLAGLTQAEREIVLSGAIKAYFTVVRSARYSIEIPGSDKKASVTEVYSAVRSPDKTTLLDVEGRQVNGEGIAAKLGDVPRLSNDASDDSRMFNSFNGDERVHTLYWSHERTGWQCQSGDTTGAYSLIVLARIFLVDTVIDAPAGAQVSVSGRQAITYAPVGSGRRSTRITLDEATLWPIMYEYLDQSGAVLSRLVLTAVNQDDAIAMPGDPSACVPVPAFS